MTNVLCTLYSGDIYITHFFFHFMPMWVLPVHMYVHHEHAWYTRRSEEGIDSLRNGVMNSCKPSCWCWESQPSSLGEQPGLFTLSYLFSPKLCLLVFFSILLLSSPWIPLFVIPVSTEVICPLVPDLFHLTWCHWGSSTYARTPGLWETA